MFLRRVDQTGPVGALLYYIHYHPCDLCLEKNLIASVPASDASLPDLGAFAILLKGLGLVSLDYMMESKDICCLTTSE